MTVQIVEGRDKDDKMKEGTRERCDEEKNKEEKKVSKRMKEEKVKEISK